MVMKRFMIAVICVLVLAGCQNNSRTPEKQVEKTKNIVWDGKTPSVVFDEWKFFVRKRGNDTVNITKVEYVGNNDKELTLTIPSQIGRWIVTSVGESYDDLPEDMEFNSSLFGECVESPHEVSGENDLTKRISTVTLPENLETIEPSAFSGLSNLKEINFPTTLVNLGGDAFYECRSLQKVTISDGLSTIHPSVFKDCNKLSCIQISEKNPYIYEKDGLIITKKENKLILAAPGKEEITIPTSVTSIEQGALSAGVLKHVNVEEGSKVFAKDGHCVYGVAEKELVVVEAENDILVVSSKVARIDDRVMSVGIKERVKKVVVGKNVKTVSGDWPGGWCEAFYECKNYEFLGSKPPHVTNIKDGSYGVPLFCTIYVPSDAVEAYKSWIAKHDASKDTKVRAL